MSTSHEVTQVTTTDAARHALRLSRLSNGLEYHISEYNAMMASLEPFRARIERSLVQYNKAIELANEFLESADRPDLCIPRFSVVVPSEVNYDATALDSACQVVNSLVDD